MTLPAPLSPSTAPLDPAITAFVDALARDLAREDHERDIATHRRETAPASTP
jgi:hypothetical protein